MNYTGIAFKHHLSKDFIENPELLHNNGAKSGATIFLDFYSMNEYLKNDGREWHIAELYLCNTPIELNFGNNYMATILEDKQSYDSFYKWIYTAK